LLNEVGWPIFLPESGNNGVVQLDKNVSGDAHHHVDEAQQRCHCIQGLCYKNAPSDGDVYHFHFNDFR
jgi:hypothetical protein